MFPGHITSQKMKFSIKHFFSKCDQTSFFAVNNFVCQQNQIFVSAQEQLNTATKKVFFMRKTNISRVFYLYNNKNRDYWSLF